MIPQDKSTYSDSGSSETDDGPTPNRYSNQAFLLSCPCFTNCGNHFSYVKVSFPATTLRYGFLSNHSSNYPLSTGLLKDFGSIQLYEYTVVMSQIGDRAVNEGTKTARPLDSSWKYTELWPKAKRKARGLSFTRMFLLPAVFGIFAILTVMLIIWAIDILI